ncbi:MAG: terminase small subunit [Clostridiales bacterium]|nr:terminase small subunit [Clostridiales bacterium]
MRKIKKLNEKLNLRQRKFAELYAQSGKAAESARRAGYSERFAAQNADKLLKNTNISEYIKEISDSLKNERIMTVKDRQIVLSDIAGNNNETPADRIRAIDTLNKMTGEYLQRVELDGTLTAEASKLDDLIRQMSDE